VQIGAARGRSAGGKADCRVFGDAERSTITFGLERGVSQFNAERRDHRVQRYGRRTQGFEQHVARARSVSASTGGRMQPDNDKCFAYFDLAANTDAACSACPPI
jgi:hypothetical protein